MKSHPLNLLGFRSGSIPQANDIEASIKRVKLLLHPDKTANHALQQLVQKSERDSISIDEVYQLEDALEKEPGGDIQQKLMSLMRRERRPYRSTWSPQCRTDPWQPLCEISDLDDMELPEKHVQSFLKELDIQQSKLPTWLHKAIVNIVRSTCIDTQMRVIERFLKYEHSSEELADYNQRHVENLEEHAKRQTAKLEDVSRLLDSKVQENHALRKKIVDLEEENSELQGDDEELEALLNNILQRRRTRTDGDGNLNDEDPDIVFVRQRPRDSPPPYFSPDGNTESAGPRKKRKTRNSKS